MKGANHFPALLESFFMDRLMRQRQASPIPSQATATPFAY
jgi:hypothetical protein